MCSSVGKARDLVAAHQNDTYFIIFIIIISFFFSVHPSFCLLVFLFVFLVTNDQSETWTRYMRAVHFPCPVEVIQSLGMCGHLSDCGSF